jgi:hypothetical protein
LRRAPRLGDLLAIANVIFNTVGARVRSLPITPGSNGADDEEWGRGRPLVPVDFLSQSDSIGMNALDIAVSSCRELI